MKQPSKTQGTQLSFWQKLGGSSAKSVEKKSSLYDQFPSAFTQTYMTNTGKAVWSPRNFEQFADEGYIKNVVAYRSIGLVAQSAATVKWHLFESDQDGKRNVKAHPLKRLMKRPNPNQSWSDFLEAVCSYRLISGNAYILAVGAEGAAPSELYCLRPDRVKVVAGAGTTPMGYEYTVGKQTRRYLVDRITGRSPILHMKNFHPTNDWYGLSAIEAAAYSIDQHNQSGVWNQALLQNGAKPSGALVVNSNADGSGGHLTDEQFLRIKSQMEEQYSGASNAGRPLLLEGGLDWKEMSLSPKDMDFIQSKHSSARDIALAFGVPPQLLGIPGDNTYSNLVEARLGLWEQTILPMLDHLQNSLNHWLVPAFERETDLSLEYSTDDIPALAPRREKIWNRIEGASFLTVNEKRRELGFDPVDGGDVIA